jgi:hypothetical protein
MLPTMISGAPMRPTPIMGGIGSQWLPLQDIESETAVAAAPSANPAREKPRPTPSRFRRRRHASSVIDSSVVVGSDSEGRRALVDDAAAGAVCCGVAGGGAGVGGFHVADSGSDSEASGGWSSPGGGGSVIVGWDGWGGGGVTSTGVESTAGGDGSEGGGGSDARGAAAWVRMGRTMSTTLANRMPSFDVSRCLCQATRMDAAQSCHGVPARARPKRMSMRAGSYCAILHLPGLGWRGRARLDEACSTEGAGSMMRG